MILKIHCLVLKIGRWRIKLKDLEKFINFRRNIR